MNPALLYLLRRSAVNGFLARLRRLRSPRYLVPTVVGLAYFVLVFGGPFGRDASGPPAGLPPDLQGEIAAREALRQGLLLEWGIAAALLLLASLSWLLPSRGPPLPFLESDVAMLFPAPVSRRELVRYKLLDIQKYIVPSTLFLSLLFGMQRGAGSVLRYALGGILFFNLMSLHGVASKLTRLSLLEHGVAGWKRQAPVLGALLGIAAVSVLGAPPFPSLEGGGFARELEDWLVAFGESPGGWALYPFRLPGRLFASPDLPAFLLNCLPVVLLLGLLYLWVDRSDAAFEEAAAENATKLAGRMEAVRRGRFGRTLEPGTKVRPSLFRLAPTGPPETAFVWRSFTETFRHVSPRFLLLLLLPLVVMLPMVLSSGEDDGGPPAGRILLTVIPLVLSGLLVFGGPALLGCSLKGDLEMAEVLKTLPIPGPRLFRGYLAASVAPGAVLSLLLVGVAALAVPSTAKAPVTPAWRLAGFMALAMVQPSLMALSALVDSGAALLFPGWVRPGQGQPQGGAEGMGYGIVTMLAKVLLLLLGGGIPVGLGALVVVAAGAAGGDLLLPAGVLAGGVLAAAAIHAEIWIASEMLGGRFDSLDPSAEGLLPA
ncbi:MAG: putative ABC exporter domain-containing protein [Planctomycetes bacterium]|nr:putative ABC exporter domain-containing protein [Planctomycetota bacterium]